MGVGSHFSSSLFRLTPIKGIPTSWSESIHLSQWCIVLTATRMICHRAVSSSSSKRKYTIVACLSYVNLKIMGGVCVGSISVEFGFVSTIPSNEFRCAPFSKFSWQWVGTECFLLLFWLVYRRSMKLRIELTVLLKSLVLMTCVAFHAGGLFELFLYMFYQTLTPNQLAASTYT